MKIDEMVDVFLNLANSVQHALLTLAPPSRYNLNLKAIIKCQKLAEHLRFQIMYCDLYLREQKPLFPLIFESNISFLSKIQNLVCEKTRRKIILLSCKKFVKTQFLGVVEFPSILLIQFFKVVVFPSDL